MKRLLTLLVALTACLAYTNAESFDRLINTEKDRYVKLSVDGCYTFYILDSMTGQLFYIQMGYGRSENKPAKVIKLEGMPKINPDESRIGRFKIESYNETLAVVFDSDEGRLWVVRKPNLVEVAIPWEK